MFTHPLKDKFRKDQFGAGNFKNVSCCTTKPKPNVVILQVGTTMSDEKMLLCHFSWSQDNFLNVQYSKTTQLWLKILLY